MTRKDVDIIGSPVYQITIDDIPDGEFRDYDLDTGVYKKYVPYDYIEIYNKSNLDLKLLINDVHQFPIPSNVVMSKTDLPFRRFRIINDSGSALTGSNLYVTVQHTPINADKAARKPESMFRKILPFIGFLR